MRVLVISPQPFYEERGTPIAVRLLLETLSQQGHRVDLLAYHEGIEVPIDGVRIFRIPRIPFVRNVPIGPSWKKLVCDAFLFWKLFALTRKNRYDVFHAVEEAVFPALLIRRLRGVSLVYDMDSSLVEQLQDKWSSLKWLNRILCRFERAAIAGSDMVIAVCSDLADRARAYGTNTPVKVIEDIPMLNEASDSTDNVSIGNVSIENLRRDLSIDGLLVLYVGNLESYQGIDLLVDAFAVMERSRPVHLVVIGGTAEAIEQYRGRATEASLADVVHFIGRRPLDQLGTFLAQADVLVSPRLAGHNTPMKLYSYLASGKAIVATKIRSHTQVLDDTCAVLVEPNAAAMAAGIAKLLQEPLLRKRLGGAAEQLARNRFSLAAYQTSVRDAYGLLHAAA